jgi:hypothetical protein
MKLFPITLIFLASCSTLPNKDVTYRALRMDYQQSEMTEDVLDDESRMHSGRVSLQYRNGEAVEDPNQFEGVISQIGVSHGSSSQTLGQLDFDMEQTQADLGIRYYFNPLQTRLIQPFLGLGVAPSVTGFDDGVDTTSKFQVGGYAELGVDAAIGQAGRIGIGGRYTGFGDTSIGDDEDVNLSSFGAFLSVGISF